MHSSAENYLHALTKDNSIRATLRRSLLLLSLVVVMSVFWGLKLTGITMAGEAFCGKAEHIHSEECPLQQLVCGQEESDAHMHTEACIACHLICKEDEIPAHTHSRDCQEKTFVCTLDESEGHTHTADCTEKELVCQLPVEESHFHTDSCYTASLSCTIEDPEHGHTYDCFEPRLTCTKAETEGHTHGDACFRELPGYICGLEAHDPHTHNVECYTYTEDVLVCGLEETEGHSHGTDCYHYGIGFGCGLTEAEGHTHTAQCITGKTQFGCGKEISDGHKHEDSCYDILEVCPLEEHIHKESCYSDIYADLETCDDWEMTLTDISRSPITAKNVLSVAQSQLGYTESIRNFEVDANGIRRGITRYGQWYGNPYGDWSSMFTSFCLYYAGLDVPFNGGAEAMRLEWEKEELFVPTVEYAPLVGNVMFLDRDLDGKADATAIIEEYDLTTITVIEGNISGDLDTSDEEIPLHTVARTVIPMGDPMILGYGLIRDGFSIMALPAGSSTVIATTTTYKKEMLTGNAVFVMYTTGTSGTFAIDGAGNAIPITIDSDGKITADVENPDTLMWSFTTSGTSYYIQNLGTKRYMHAFSSNGGGVTSDGKYTSSLVNSGSGVKVKSNTTDYARLDAAAGKFVATTTANQAAVYSFGIRNTYTLWLDGTCGGMGHLTGSPDESFTVAEGQAFRLPESWETPDKYAYRLRGWYDITNSQYYVPGQEITIDRNTVLYADWVANTYDIGIFNAHVADTVSTSSFITTRMFDYNYLFNVQSANPSITVSASDHSESWSMITSGKVNYKDQDTFDFIFVDNESTGRLTIPNNRSSRNTFPGVGIVTSGIYSSGLYDLLFSTGNAFDPETGEGILGKTYLGTGDHLFQIMDDPSDEHYGYYYYDSKRNAAAFNQSDGRFYVYEYLAATSDSFGSDGNKSDFLPLNSPYANTNGNNITSYTYDGVNGEYKGVPHYRYDAKYSSSSDCVNTDFAYGMRMDLAFYLPQVPGTGGNKDINGNDMEFDFTGDDDLWVLIDGKLVLDLGGIHTSVNGSINFSTGEIFVKDSLAGNMSSLNIGDGDHTLTVLYLERGSSMSNCSIYFNLAPRFGLELRKEDVLTQELLDGTQFTVYEDFDCTVPAELWESQREYNSGVPAKSTFTIQNGVASIWGLGSGNTYYLRETKAPDAEGYSAALGLIKLTLEKEGFATYNAEIIPDADGNEPSKGYTLHGVRIDEDTKTMYITVTNAPESVVETTTVQVLKKWEDNVSHSDDYITAYLTVTDSEGNVRRIRETILSDENEWTHIWTNLPKYDYDQLTEIHYGIEESYESGYYSTVRKITQISLEKVSWAEATSFKSGESYALKFGTDQYLSTTSTSDNKLIWVTEATARTSPLAMWKVSISSNRVKFTNGAGQILTFNNGNTSNRYFYATTSSNNYQNFTAVDAGNGFRFYYTRNSSKYYMMELQTNGRISANTSGANSGMVLTPMIRKSEIHVEDVQDWAYEITNTPLPKDNETSMTVEKIWNMPDGNDPTKYQEFQVTVRLLANGVNTGRSVTLTLKNDWKGVFQGLPYTDEDGEVIVYTVDEIWTKEKWSTSYGEIIPSSGSPPTYSTTITNTYHPGGPELPSTGTASRLMYILCGSSLMLFSLVYGIGLRRREERRRK